MNFRDVEHLSAYLDGQLSPTEVTRLESRLVADEPLRRALDDLRVARGLLRRVPRRKAPRNFTLNPFNERVLAPRPRAIPVLRSAGAIASLLFALTVGINTLGPTAVRTLASAPVPDYGMGGGMGGGAPDAEVPPELFAAVPQGTPEAAEAAPAEAPADMATAEALAKSAPAEPGMAAEAQREGLTPISPVWIMLLAVAAIVLVSLAWYLDRLTRRNFRSRVMEK